MNIYDIKRGRLCIFRAARLMAVLPHDSRLRRSSSEQGFSFMENLMIGIFDFLKMDAYYNMVSAGTSVEKKAWRQIVSDAPKPTLQEFKDKEQPKPVDAEYVHPRDALKAVRRMITTKAYNQTYGSK